LELIQARSDHILGLVVDISIRFLILFNKEAFPSYQVISGYGLHHVLKFGSMADLVRGRKLSTFIWFQPEWTCSAHFLERDEEKSIANQLNYSLSPRAVCFLFVFVVQVCLIIFLICFNYFLICFNYFNMLMSKILLKK
jgi:hypothetical protein